MVAYRHSQGVFHIHSALLPRSIFSNHLWGYIAVVTKGRSATWSRVRTTPPTLMTTTGSIVRTGAIAAIVGV